MAKKRVSGIGALDNKIKAKRNELSKIKKAEREATQRKKKLATLAKLERQVKAKKSRKKK